MYVGVINFIWGGGGKFLLPNLAFKGNRNTHAKCFYLHVYYGTCIFFVDQCF